MEGRYGRIEVRVADAQQVADMTRAFHVLQVMLTEDLQWHIAQVRLQDGGPVHDAVLRSTVTKTLRGHALFLSDAAHHLILPAVDQLATGLDGLDEEAELVHIALEGLEDVDVVPGDPTDQCDVRLVQVELRYGFQGRGEVLVTLDDGHRALVAELHHAVEAIELCAHEVVEVHPDLAQDMHDHAGDGGLAMTTADHHAGLVPGAFVEVRGIAEHGYAQFLCALQLGIVQTCMHAEDHGAQPLVDTERIPPQLVRQKTQALQSAPARLEDLIVATGDIEALLVQCDGQVVHGAATDRDEMDL